MPGLVADWQWWHFGAVLDSVSVSPWELPPQRLSLFGLSRVAYGWVRRFPLDKWCKALDRQILHTLGQFNYGIFKLKQILIQAHMGAQANVIFRLTRLLALRNRVLEKIGHGGIQCALDEMVYERLGSL